MLAAGLHVGAPQKVSVALGLQRAIKESTPAAQQLVFGLVEPGLGAGRASIGYGSFGDFGAGFTVRGSVLRTFSKPRNVAPNQTFVGLEGAGHFFLFNVRAGAFRRTSTGTGSATLYTIDWGLLF
ncbi:MAG TPA: hypothetical protein VE869_09780 [Gemmatimonas sp.]|nr:hypothetical protein [Gemmatimonas sp.]